jgi:glutathione peroxidase-family protein
LNIYELKMSSIEGKSVDFSQYKDEALLIVNLASQ